MFKLKLSIITLAIILLIQPLQNVSAQMLVSEVKIGDSSSARNEFIEIYNSGKEDFEITNWCLQYTTSSQVNYRLSCFFPSEDNVHLFLPASGFALAVSSELLNDPASLMAADISFSARLSGASGYVSLIDNYSNQIDDIGWGQEGVDNNLISPPVDNLIFKRKMSPDGVMQDTGIYRDDFEFSSMKTEYSIGNIYELKDLCPNIDGIQALVPDGYDNSTGECQLLVIDICPNIDGTQSTIPDGFLIDTDFNCINTDVCLNLPDIQLTIPDDYILRNDNCEEKSLPIDITEIYPNAVGSDDGFEFIEIYNPNLVNVNLENYSINVNGKKYNLSQTPLEIKPNDYRAFYNYDVKFSLLNSLANIFIYSNDDTYLGEKIEYKSPKEGESWAFIDGSWRYTNQPTPNSKNMSSKIISKIIIETQLKPCGPGQYRNPETNRCRNIVSSSDSTLKPCEPGYERNPETNRCRKIVNTSIPSVGYKVEQIDEQTNNGVLITSIAGVGTMAVGYGLWEWRKDFAKLLKKVITIFHTNS